MTDRVLLAFLFGPLVFWAIVVHARPVATVLIVGAIAFGVFRAAKTWGWKGTLIAVVCVVGAIAISALLGGKGGAGLNHVTDPWRHH